jgi:threonine/homoserine/homoserine lactone efflux protein
VPDLHTLVVFAAASLVLLVVPGPAVLYIVARGLHHGRSAGLVSVLGVEAGNMVHVAAATVGVSAVLASSATAFVIVKYAGAGYLVWLGARAMLRGGAHRSERPPAPGRGRLFRDGLVVAALNPKTALFFLAFLPQFVDPAQGAAAVQLGVLGSTFVGLGFVTDGAYALAAGAAGTRLGSLTRPARLVGRAGGLVYVGLGTAAALSGDRPPR